MKVTYYLDVLSLWCLYAERSVQRLLAAHPKIDLDWRIALSRGDAPLGYTAEQMAWYFKRGAAITELELDSSGYTDATLGTAPANYAVEAARLLGAGDHRARLAVMEASMMEGRPLWRREVALEVVAQATGLDTRELSATMDLPRVRERVHATSHEFVALGIENRPAFVFENVIPDKAILSGIWAYEPLEALYETMLQDEERFLDFNRAHPEPNRVTV